MLTSAKLQSETITILITSFLWLLDLLRFALIQRGNVFFWMHVCPKNGGTLCCHLRQQGHIRVPHKSRRSALLHASVIMSISTQGERLQGSLSIAEVIANLLSDWNAANARSVCGPKRRPSIFHDFPFYSDP
jgi:hypothetical protein